MRETMRQVRRSGAIAGLLLAIASAGWAGPLEDGLAAYDRGEFERALALWQPLAEAGDADAQFNLGFLHANGQGVAVDPAEAARWFRRAADQGEPIAQFALGVMYANGDGVAQDAVAARMWFALAAARQTDAERRERAARNRDLIALKMTEAEVGESDRRVRDWRPKTER